MSAQGTIADHQQGAFVGRLALEVEGLKKYFPVRRGLLKRTRAEIRAVDGVSFTIKEGETLCLVGESGSGKSTVGRLVLRLIEPTAGHVRFEGRDVLALRAGDLNELRRHA